MFWGVLVFRSVPVFQFFRSVAVLRCSGVPVFLVLVHAVLRRFKDFLTPENSRYHTLRDATGTPTIPKSSKIHRDNSSSNIMDVLDVEAITKGKHHNQLSMQHADFAEKNEIFSRYA